MFDGIWEHRCIDGIGGCTAISAAYLVELRSAERRLQARIAELEERLAFAEIVCSQVEINGMSWDVFKSRVTAMADA